MAKNTSKKLTESKVSTETGKTEYFVIVDPDNESCSKILTGKAAASREGRSWLGEYRYGNGTIFVAQIVGEMRKKDSVKKDLPVIEV